jgi:putative membrane protein
VCIAAAVAALGLLAATHILAQTVPAENMNRANNPPAAIAPAAPGMPGSLRGQSAQLDQQDQHFLREAAMGNLAEIQAGQVAMQKGNTPAAKEFGRWMVTDHTLIGELMKMSLRGTGFTPPDSVTSEHQQMLTHLRSLSRAEFDRQYITGMVKDHQQDVALFREASTSAQTPAVRDFATLVLPVIQQHLEEAQSLQAVKGKMAEEKR